MKTELFYLVLVTALTGLLWVPYVLDRFVRRGIMNTIGYPEDPAPHSPWAARLIKAHANAVENLAVFAPLILIAHGMGYAGPAIATAAVVYFWARLVHAVAYTLAIPGLRTLAFLAGFFAQAAVAWQLVVNY